MSNSASLLYDIIHHYYARMEGNVEVLPERKLLPELFNYRYTSYSIKLLELLLESKCSMNEIKKYPNYITTWNLFQNGHVGLLHSLLKYNLLDVKELENCPEINFESSDQNSGILNPGREFRIGQVTKFRWHDLLGLQKFLYKMERCTCVSRRRLQIVLWGLDTITTLDVTGNLTLKKMMCMRTLFEFTREPFITSSEIMNIIQHMEIGDISPPSLQKWRGIYEEFFPESKLSYQPRSLQHLCRFRIRRSLEEAGRFLDEMGHLPPPLGIIPEVPKVDSEDFSAYVKNKDITLQFRRSLERDYMFQMRMKLLNGLPALHPWGNSNLSFTF